MKDFFLHKLTLRVIYIAGAFTTAHLVSLASLPAVQDVLSKAGVSLTINDPAKLKAYLTGLMLIGGEFVYEYLHGRFVMPHVEPAKADA